MRKKRASLGILLAAAVGALAVAPAAQAVIYERFRFVDEPYSFEETICGIDVEVEGTASGVGRIRAGTGKRATAFFEHNNLAFSETWTAANGKFVTITANLLFKEIKAVPLGDNVFRFTAIEAGQPFTLYDSEGNLVLRDRGSVHFSIVFDTLGDATPGGVLIEELEPSVHGPHPGLGDNLCTALVPLLSGP